MLTIWGRRNSSNVMPVMWTAAELNLTYRRIDAGSAFGGLDSVEFLTMNPNGKIPVIDDDGFVLWESNAIVRYLVKRYGAGILAPASELDYARADQWMEWYKSTVYPLYIDLLWATVRTEPARRDPTAIARAAHQLGQGLKILDNRLASTSYLLGEQLTMADIPIGSMMYRYYQLAIERPQLHHVAAWYQRLSERPAYRQHIAFPFGSRPAEWYLYEQRGTQLLPSESS